MTYVTYMLKCADETFYIGSTNDLRKRLHQHNFLKSGAHYTKLRRPVAMVYSEVFETMSEARKRENVLKQLTRAEKFTLVHNLSRNTLRK